jgi:3-deoxy-D-manno-octulosonic-acid transferase
MMLRRLYAGLGWLAAPALRLMLRRRLASGREVAGRLGERRGIDPTPRPPGRLIWLHAASVGETLSLLPVLAALAARAPATLLMTTGTVTSADTLARRLPELGLQGRVLHRFVPLDVPAWTARFLDHWRPDVAGFVESEIWPNLLTGCARRGIPTVLVNARLSPGSSSRWRRAPGLARELFGGFAAVHAQTGGDAGRIAALGGPAAALTGNLKLAAEPLPCDAAELARLRALLAGRPIWLAACVHPGEDAAILAVHAQLARHHPGLLTIVVPRHPERGARMAELARDVVWTRRAIDRDPPATAGVWIADTLGELGLFYRLAGLAFVGRSLGTEHGGQNPLEPARLGCAVVMGPNVENFPEIVPLLEAAGALARVADAASLAAWLDGMLADPVLRRAMGQAGIAAARGVGELPERVAALLLDLAAAP